jgi:hypothetical protein
MKGDVNNWLMVPLETMRNKRKRGTFDATKFPLSYKGVHYKIVLFFVVSVSEEDKGFGPIFEEQPINTIYPEESLEGKVSLNCRARASPFPVYK